jgi:hypothetical protein
MTWVLPLASKHMTGWGDSMMGVSRRDAMLLAAGAVGAAASAASSAAGAALPTGMIAPDDEAGWARIAALYPRMGPVTQLEHGYWGNMAAPVAEAHRANIDRLNRDTSAYARRAMRQDLEIVRARRASDGRAAAGDRILPKCRRRPAGADHAISGCWCQW